MSTRRAAGVGAVQITSAERIDTRELIVEFSDGTYALFSAEQLMEMAPNRKQVDSRPLQR